MRRMILCLAAGLLLAGSALHAGSLSGTVHCKGMRHNADAVVYVEAVPGRTFPAPSEHVQMNQENMEFVPHVLPVLVGATVDFLNSDPVLHNVFTPDKCAEKFNLGSWPQGQTRSYTFKRRCVATLLCNVHPEMEAFIVAVPTPYFAVTNRGGSYSIEGVPDGSYTAKVWHPRLKEASRQVAVSGATTADFELSR